jgi:putative ABC transport system ATP-binding protein
MNDADPVPAAIELRGVSKRYEAVTAADNVSLAVEPGTLIALTGASGSGKSTLLHLIGAIERPDAGTIVSGGTGLTALHGAALAAYRRTVGFVFQRYNLLPALTALDNVIAPVPPYRTAWDKPGRGRRLLEEVGIGGRERSLPARMSGGEQQRVAIARAPDQDPAPAAGRRADRQPGLADRHRDPRPADQAAPRERDDGHHRYP